MVFFPFRQIPSPFLCFLCNLCNIIIMTQKRTAISDEVKYEICDYQTKNQHISHIDIAAYFNQLYNLDIKRSTISKILKEKERWLSIVNISVPIYKYREVKYSLLEQALSI